MRIDCRVASKKLNLTNALLTQLRYDLLESIEWRMGSGCLVVRGYIAHGTLMGADRRDVKGYKIDVKSARSAPSLHS
jgi:hypothetical protein